MKRVIWLPLGLVVLIVVLVLLFVSRSQYGELEADYDALQADLVSVQVSYDSLEQELESIEKVYPPRDFSSEEELENWLLENDVSEQPSAETVEELYAKGLEVPYSFYWFVYGVAIIDGEIWLWEVETDEPFKAQNWDKVK